MTVNRQALVLMLGAACALASGCGTTKPVRYYALTAVTAESSAQNDAPAAARATVGIVDVRLPVYLDRPHVVTGGEGNRLVLHDQDRWAEPLKEGCARVLAADLAALLPGHLVRHHGWLDKSQLDFAVTVVMERFKKQHDGNVILVADWSVLRKGAEQSANTLRREYAADTEGTSTDALALTMSRLLSRLAADMAEEITSGEAQAVPRP